ncbi:tRNA (cytosine-5-)-methyltransferase [Aureococcus anophagefferens]|nr:tRNA (cytosine-5-)-methyltransferase [Aureococcus anophagefferens]
MPKAKQNKQGAARFEAYYALQHIVPDSEWPTLLKTLATPLPITFRITDATHDGHAAWLEAEAARLGATRLPWYACGASTAWTFAGESRRGLRAARDAARDAALRDFLVSGTTSRNLSRQEAVSMVPALLLGAAPGWAVLDACAAPGNKTAQLLERCGPGGLVVANDLSKKRRGALAGPDGRFDGVLCDVPCSGDGTIRKAPRVREAWACDGGDRLHGTQVAIARRCAALLRPGGRMVYSTCSLNPVENEAVVAEVLRLEPTLELAAAASPLPARPGLTTSAPPVSPPAPPPPPAPPLVDGAYRPMGADAWAAVADFLDLAAAPGHVMVRSEHGEAAGC